MTATGRTVLQMLPDLQLGGGQVLVLRAALGLARHGVRTHVCSVWRDQPGSMRERFEAAGFPVLDLGLRRSLFPVAVARLARHCRRHHVDLVHCNNTHYDRLLGAWAARLTGVPAVNSFHSMRFAPRPGWAEATSDRLLRGRFAAGIAVSEIVREEWAGYAARIGLSPERVHIVHTGVDLAEHPLRSDDDRRARRHALGLDGGRLLLNVARLVEGKGHPELFRAVALLLPKWPDLVLVLAGDGALRTELEELASGLGIARAVRFLGHRDDVPALLPLADAFVFPSVGEGLPLSVLEAMAARRAVVAFELPGLREAMPPDVAEASLVPQGDVEAFAGAIDALLADPTRAARLGDRGRAAVEASFSLEASARDTLRVYDSVWSGSGSAT